MTRIDLHIHTLFSPDSLMEPEELVSRCLGTGLNCIAVTDHNTIEGAQEVQRLAIIRVILGEEIKSSGGEIIGRVSPNLNLIATYISPELAREQPVHCDRSTRSVNRG